jgi:hypothetical protein
LGKSVGARDGVVVVDGDGTGRIILAGQPVIARIEF